jgi:recombinational DNA repair protein (RecF pathway)
MSRRITEAEARDKITSAGFQPLEPFPGSQVPWRLRCMTCGQESSPRFSNLVNRGSKCRFCADKEKGEKRRLDPEIVYRGMIEAGVIPLEPYPGAQIQPWRSRCVVCDREVRPSYANIKKGHQACNYCAHERRASSNMNDPGEAKEIAFDAGLTPLEPYPGGGKPWFCLCNKCGKEVTPRLDNIKSGQGACKWCAGQVVTPEEAEQVMLQAGVTPLEPYPNSQRPWKCRCNTCEREIFPRFSHVKRRTNGPCAFCAGKKISPEDAEAEMRTAGLTPLEPYASAKNPWKCRCETCKQTVYPTQDSIHQGKGGCRHCTPRGFHAEEPGKLYLVEHKEFQTLKIGITNTNIKTDRLAQHRKHGWVVRQSWQFEDGKQAQKIEAIVLRWWRTDLQAPVALGIWQMPQGGWTETASTERVGLEETVDFVNQAVGDNSLN